MSRDRVRTDAQQVAPAIGWNVEDRQAGRLALVMLSSSLHAVLNVSSTFIFLSGLLSFPLQQELVPLLKVKSVSRHDILSAASSPMPRPE